MVAFIARLGFLADLLSKPVLVGYLAGVAVIMIAGQLERFSGMPSRGRDPPRAIASFVANLGEIHRTTAGLAGAS